MEAFDGLESGGYNAADWIEKVRRARLYEAVERSISGDQHEYQNPPSRNVLPRRRHGLRVACGQTLPPIVGNRAVDDRAAVNALPGVENEEEV